MRHHSALASGKNPFLTPIFKPEGRLTRWPKGAGRYVDGFLLLSGDAQSGTDKILLSGDAQSGTDKLLYREPE